jgi:hypothetical protein
MRRSTGKSSVIFRDVLKQAEEQLAHAARAAANFKHKGIRGDERANSLRQFLNDHLPNVFATRKGEAIDFKDTRTGQIDFCVYDSATSSPIQSSAENALIPAEALYAVVEVKSVLTQDELNNCIEAAKRIRTLRPFKTRFCAPPARGEIPTGPRCQYIIFAYTSNLAETDWAQKEFNRIKNAASAADGSLDLVDQVLVLDRGVIRPKSAEAVMRDEDKGIFLEFYLHLMNFLTREKRRRPEIDWTAYTSRPVRDKLT